MLNQLSLKAMIIGLLVDIIGSFVLGIVLGIIGIVIYVSKGNNIDTAVTDYYASTPLLLVSLILGLLMTTAGGYFAAKYSNGNEIPNSVAVGILSLLFGLFFIFSLPIWYSVLSYVLIIPCAYLGGFNYKRKNCDV